MSKNTYLKNFEIYLFFPSIAHLLWQMEWQRAITFNFQTWIFIDFLTFILIHYIVIHGYSLTLSAPNESTINASQNQTINNFLFCKLV